MTCKDCIHYDVCGMCGDEDDIRAMTFCYYFKDKSRFIELPCNVGETLYVIERDFADNLSIVTYHYITANQIFDVLKRKYFEICLFTTTDYSEVQVKLKEFENA